MTPQQELIAAVLVACDQYVEGDPAIHILTTPSVQAALAKVRGEAVQAYSKELDRKWDESILGAEFLAATPKPEPVLRFDAAFIARMDRQIAEWDADEPREDWFNYQRDFLAVRDWLKRAGCV